MNKEAAGDELGPTLQTNFVIKALVGLFENSAALYLWATAR